MNDESTPRGERRIQEILDDGSSIPLQPDELREAAREILEPGPRSFLFAGSGTGETMADNRRAFDDIHIRPRVLRDISDRSLEVEVCDTTLPVPVLAAPIGAQSIWHDDGELATASAARDAGVPLCLSTMATRSMESVAAEVENLPRWFQLYCVSDQSVCESIVHRAEEAGYSAIVVTVDTPTMGWRTKILESRYAAFQEADPLANFTEDPAFRNLLDNPPEDDPEAALDMIGNILDQLSLTWDDIANLRASTDLPVIVKGIRHPADAELAATHADGVVVSNHGGRQIDGEHGTLRVLPEIVDAVDGQVPVLFDGGIRTGADIFKAIALGADAVLVGRPYIYGLSVAGVDGAKEVFENLVAELDLTMALSGYNNITDVGREVIDIDF